MTQMRAPGRSAVVTVEETGSTQDDLRALADDAIGWPHLSGLRAVHQRAGRGRGERTWDTDELTALTATLVLRPALPVQRWPWIPMLAGCAVVDVINTFGPTSPDAAPPWPDPHGPAGVKWPNDVVLPAASEIDGWGRLRKVGGLLAEVLPGQDCVLLGIGVNLAGSAPVPWATTLHEHGIDIAAHDLLEAVRARLAEALVSDPHTWRAAVERRCVSIGAQVIAHLPGGLGVSGTARAIDDGGGLVIREASGAERVIMAGDVEHLRAATGEGR